MALTWIKIVLSAGELTNVVVANRVMASMLLLLVGWLVINQKRLAEERDANQIKLRESEERFRHIFEYAGTGIAITDLSGRFIQCNPAYCAITGYTEEELLRFAYPSLIHPDDREANVRGVQGLLYGNCPSFETENRYVHKTGHSVWVHKYESVLYDEDRRPTHCIKLVTDITGRKRAETALQDWNATLEQHVQERTAALAEANERWDLVLRATQDGIWDWDLLHDSAYFSPRWKEIHGFSDSDEMESMKEWSARIHPEDQRRVLGKLEAYLEAKEPQFYEEYRIQKKQGTYVWVLDRGVAIFNDQGRAIRMVGAETDITWRKESEEALRRREHEFRTLADNVPALFSYIDREQRYRFVNKRYEELFGRSDEEIAGTPVQALLGRDNYAQVRPYLENALAGESVAFAYELKMPGVHTHYLSAHYVPDRDDQGQVVGLFALLSDVTALKSSEAALRDLSAKLLRAQEEERRRIARDLHDDVMQRMAALTLELHNLSVSLKSGDDVLRVRLKGLGATAERLTTDLQQMAHGLHPSILEHAELEAAVREHVHEFSAATGLATEVMVRNVPEKIPIEHATCLYRVLQEGLQNVRKHANATSVLVRLLETDRGVGLCVHDDGHGIENADGLTQRNGLGLTSMAERVWALKGTFRIRSKPGIGTEIHAWVPLEGVRHKT